MVAGHYDITLSTIIPTTRKTDEYFKKTLVPLNVMSFLVSRQLGRQRNYSNLRKWVWLRILENLGAMSQK
ncbi:embryonic testis differentiation protein homolog B-like [Echinops telfairi]|uniref:Embryonic testis differentiation protein homolog B-like n=1 Tax=Echinops telfairi TaxID=9371 RepID=A0ABM1VJD5_ECHTE|nr:embryonic testis differentiation protein homolog B-like [Echinops telfairi]